MTKTRIAVVSTDRVHVNDHFGKAERFLIYDVDNTLKLVEERPTERLSVGDPDHPFDADKFGRISDLLHDCDKVYMTRIGEGPAAKLNAMGIETVIFDGPIDAIANT
jgi:nitrogen fixation protein NifX